MNTACRLNALRRYIHRVKPNFFKSPGLCAHEDSFDTLLALLEAVESESGDSDFSALHTVHYKTRTHCLSCFFGRDTSEPVIDLDVTVPPTLQNLVDQWVLKRSTLECTKHGVNHGEEKNDVLEYPRMLMVRLKYSSTLHTERPMVLTNQHVNIQDERYLVRPPLTT